MKRSKPKKAMVSMPGTLHRETVTVSQHELVAMEPLGEPGGAEPGGAVLVVTPRAEGVQLEAWAANHRGLIDRLLLEHGGLLFRGFAVDSSARFRSVFTAACGDLLEYTYRSTPRSEVSGKVYTSTEYPAAQSIPMHNEMSYSASWPMRIGFYCAEPAEHGGATPLADSRRVFEAIDAKIRRRFEERRVMYVRNYGEHLDLPWQNVFQTEDRGEVEAFCRRAGIELEWRGGDRLQTRQICSAIARHPQLGAEVWFNQAHLFHPSSLEPEVRELLLESLDEGDLPRNSCHADGSAFDESDLEQIRAAYRQEMIVFPWQRGDLLLLDNMLVAHGREPFRGARRVLVAMAQPHGGPTEKGAVAP